MVAADGPGAYPVVSCSTAGGAAPARVAPGQVAYITTGAPLPEVSSAAWIPCFPVVKEARGV